MLQKFFHHLKKTPGNNFQNVNTATYSSLALSKTERRYVTTTDGKRCWFGWFYLQILTPQKKYPTLLYCQGGPQSPLTHFIPTDGIYSWLLTVILLWLKPSRNARHGVAWNEQISKDWVVR
jgi:dipeptidyl aminopeptidase/acylaminoacyl peptidase